MFSTEEIIFLVPLVFIGLAAIISTKAFFLNAPFPYKLFSTVCIITFLVELAGHCLKNDETPNYWLYNSYNYLVYMLLARVYSNHLSSDAVKITIQFFYLIFTAFFICNTIFIQGLFPLQTLTIVLGGGFIFFLAGSYFWELLVSPDNEKITRDPFFWFSFGLIVYFGGTVPFLGMFNYLQDNFFEFTVFYLMYFSNGFSIFLSLHIIIGFLCRRNFQKLS